MIYWRKKSIESICCQVFKSSFNWILSSGILFVKGEEEEEKNNKLEAEF